MKKVLLAAATCGVIFAVSCKKEDKTIDKDFSYSIPTEAIVGNSIVVEDLSINVKSRTWTFEDALPETSTESKVSVTFTKDGDKKVTLTVNYADGTKDEVTKTVTVKDYFSAQIHAEGLTPNHCAAKGTEITFSLDPLENKSGMDLTYAWTFPGATPATSTESKPKVVWNSQINDLEVTCTVTRSDGAKLELSYPLTAGNYPLLKVDNYDVYGFEKGEGCTKGWYDWIQFPGEAAAGEHPNNFTIVDGGANGTAKAMKIDISPITNGTDICEIAHRNSWPTNAWLEVGKKYEFTFWLKSEGAYGACYWVHLYSYCPDWLNDPLRGAAAKEDWKEVFGSDFVEGGQIRLYENAITSVIQDDTQEAGYRIEGALSTEWTKYTFEFTPSGTEGDVYRNCYLCLGISGMGAKIYIDEVQINLIEE